MRGPWESNCPLSGHFGPQFAGMGRPSSGCPFRGDAPDHHDWKPSFGPFGRPRFDRSPERHGHCHREPERPRWGPFGFGYRGPPRPGSSECHCCGPHSRCHRQERSCHSPGTHRPHPWFGRSDDHHCCGRRGPSGCCERPCARPCEETCGSNHHRSGCCRHAPCRSSCDHRRSCHDNCCEGRSRNAHCEKCCDSEPCCGGDKEDCERDDSLDRKENESSNERDNKIRVVILWLLRELFWKTLKGRHLTDANMETIIVSTTALQRSLELETDRIVKETYRQGRK